MVYRRRYKRMRRKRSLGGKKQPSYAIKKYVRSQLNKNIEMKLRQYTYDSVGIDPVTAAAASFASVSYGSGTIISGLCAGVANGTGEGQRVGNKITLRGLQVNLALQPGDNTNYLRFIIATPKKEVTKSTIAAMTQQLLSNAGSSATQWLSPVDTDVWKVYMDKRFWFQYRPVDGSTATSVPQAKFLKKFIKFRKNIKWALAAPVPPTNDVYLIAISDSGLASNPGAVAGFVKIWYQDG